MLFLIKGTCFCNNFLTFFPFSYKIFLKPIWKRYHTKIYQMMYLLVVENSQVFLKSSHLAITFYLQRFWDWSYNNKSSKRTFQQHISCRYWSLRIRSIDVFFLDTTLSLVNSLVMYKIQIQNFLYIFQWKFWGNQNISRSVSNWIK